MQYLVTMTTQVPPGAPEEAVSGMRTREAARARELAAAGHLLRLWRPPLQPGEWRTLGLFAAEDPGRLEGVLASMPLRVWRSDVVTPLQPHPNDPGAPQRRTPGAPPEFLIGFSIVVPGGTDAQAVERTKALEAARALELAEEGHLLRLWTPPAEPGAWRVLGLWQEEDAGAMQAILESLPLSPWVTAEITPLSPHPNDPAAVS